MKPVIGVIEWSSDKAAEPAVFLADSEVDVRRAVVEFLAPSVGRGDIAYITEAWVAQWPTPDLADDAAVTAWLDALREESTDAWLTIYYAGGDAGGDMYRDVRGQGQPVKVEGVKTYDHDARPDDDPEPGDRCKDCGEDISWIGPSLTRDWEHVDG